MLIICTQDQAIVAHAQAAGSGAPEWGALNILPPNQTQRTANTQFGTFLAALGANPTEPLCLSAHGSNTEIGDAGPQGWTWNLDAAALLLATGPPGGWLGPILIHACAQNVANFSAGLAGTLQRNRVCRGMWCYGYNVAVNANTNYPNPQNLPNQAALQGTQVL